MPLQKNLSSFLLLMRELQKIDPEFPLQYAICLAEIAMTEGLSITDLSQKTGLALSTVSRIVGALSRHRQSGTPYDLIKVNIAADERRRKEITLTPKGRAIINGITDIIERF